MLGGDGAHVLILTPFRVLLRVQFGTVMPSTSFSSGYFPKLPMLIPWPGPHVMPEMSMFVVPGPNDMQSSPVAMFTLLIRTLFDELTWIPSVLGLSIGANIDMWLITMPSQLFTWRWNISLFFEVIPSIDEFLTNFNFKDCENTYKNEMVRLLFSFIYTFNNATQPRFENGFLLNYQMMLRHMFLCFLTLSPSPSLYQNYHTLLLYK